MEKVLVNAIGKKQAKFRPTFESLKHLRSGIGPGEKVLGDSVEIDGLVAVVSSRSTWMPERPLCIPNIKTIPTVRRAFPGRYPIVIWPVPRGTIDIEQEVISHRYRVNHLKSIFPVGLAVHIGSLQAGVEFIPGVIISFGKSSVGIADGILNLNVEA